jgi:hypothetical protein
VWVQDVVTFEEVDEQRLNTIPKGKSCEINFRSLWNFRDNLFYGTCQTLKFLGDKGEISLCV